MPYSMNNLKTPYSYPLCFDPLAMRQAYSPLYSDPVSFITSSSNKDVNMWSCPNPLEQTKYPWQSRDVLESVEAPKEAEKKVNEVYLASMLSAFTSGACFAPKKKCGDLSIVPEPMAALQSPDDKLVTNDSTPYQKVNDSLIKFVTFKHGTSSCVYVKHNDLKAHWTTFILDSLASMAIGVIAIFGYEDQYFNCCKLSRILFLISSIRLHSSCN
jgi:hypothetical protein